MSTPDDSRPHSKSEMRRLDAQKPREWRYVGKFISQQGSQYAIIEGPEFGEHKVRLVERSEYDRVCAERDELKLQLQFTNSGWPHEKKLHEEIAQLKAERDEWQDEYQNVCKFVTQYEEQCDQLKAELAQLKAKLKELCD